MNLQGFDAFRGCRNGQVPGGARLLNLRIKRVGARAFRARPERVALRDGMRILADPVERDNVTWVRADDRWREPGRSVADRDVVCCGGRGRGEFGDGGDAYRGRGRGRSKYDRFWRTTTNGGEQLLRDSRQRRLRGRRTTGK